VNELLPVTKLSPRVVQPVEMEKIWTILNLLVVEGPIPRLTKEWLARLAIEVLAATPMEVSKVKRPKGSAQSDKENSTRLQGDIGKGQELVQTQSVQAAS